MARWVAKGVTAHRELFEMSWDNDDRATLAMR